MLITNLPALADIIAKLPDSEGNLDSSFVSFSARDIFLEPLNSYFLPAGIKKGLGNIIVYRECVLNMLEAGNSIRLLLEWNIFTFARLLYRNYCVAACYWRLGK